MSIDWEAALSGGRGLWTGDRFEARYIGRGSNPSYPRVVEIRRCGTWEPEICTDDGRFDLEHATSRDLIQEDEVIEFEQYFNIYHDMLGLPHRTRKEVETNVDCDIVGIAKVVVRIQGKKVTITGGTDE